jgi:hypothetical protein
MAQRRGFSHQAQEAVRVQGRKLGILSWLDWPPRSVSRHFRGVENGTLGQWARISRLRVVRRGRCRFSNDQTSQRQLHQFATRFKEDDRWQDCAGGSSYRGCLPLRGFGFHAFLPSHVIFRPDFPPPLALSAEICSVGRHFLEEYGSESDARYSHPLSGCIAWNITQSSLTSCRCQSLQLCLALALLACQIAVRLFCPASQALHNRTQCSCHERNVPQCARS